MTKMKRLISTLMALCMILSVMPILQTEVSAANIENWSPWAENGARGTCELDTEVKYEGKAAVKFTYPDSMKANV